MESRVTPKCSAICSTETHGSVMMRSRSRRLGGTKSYSIGKAPVYQAIVEPASERLASTPNRAFIVLPITLLEGARHEQHFPDPGPARHPRPCSRTRRWPDRMVPAQHPRRCTPQNAGSPPQTPASPACPAGVAGSLLKPPPPRAPRARTSRSAPPTPKARRPRRTTRNWRPPSPPPKHRGPNPRTRANSQQARVIRRPPRPEGATVRQICEATGWQTHTVRGAFAEAFKKNLGLTPVSDKQPGGEWVYRVA